MNEKQLKKKAQQIKAELSDLISNIKENDIQDDDWFINFEVELCKMLG